MSGTHPPEEMVQLYVLTREACSPEAIGHIENCPDCRAAVAAYGLLSDELARQPVPEFNFDLTAVVMAGVQEINARERLDAAPAKQQKASAAGMAVMIVLVIGVPAWLFRKSAYFVFTDMSAVFYWVLLAAAAIIVGFFL